MAVTTGLRRGELLALTWRDVDLGGLGTQAEEWLLVGPAWEDHDLVFSAHRGRPLIGSNVLNQYFHPILKRAGLPRMRFHDLRRTAATLLLLRRVHPKVVSEPLGHSSVSLTLDVYSHVLSDMQRAATTALDRMLAER